MNREYLSELGRWIEVALIVAGITAVTTIVGITGGLLAEIGAGAALAVLWLMT